MNHLVTLAAWLALGPAVPVRADAPPPAATPSTAATPASTPAAPVPSASTAPAATAPVSPAPTDAPPAPFGFDRPEIRSFIDEGLARGLTRRELKRALRMATVQPKIIEAMNRPAEKTLPWWEYRARMVTPTRIVEGVAVWRAHRALLEQIAEQYQVPAEYLIALLGVETEYGRNTGRFRVLDALATLAFDYPARAPFFRNELLEFLLLCDEQGFDAPAVRGSYAGAMGQPQFMPSNYRKLAVGPGPGTRRDLWNDWGDIFASTANFLHTAGWQPGESVLVEAPFPLTTPAPSEHMTLSTSIGELRAEGGLIDPALPDATPALLLAAPKPDAPAYRVGLRNFLVLTRYNSSPLYAMSVHDLAQAIRAKLGESTP